MSRISGNSYLNGRLFNGYDYTRQTWVADGVYVRCGHPESTKCSCYGRQHAGERCTEREPVEKGSEQ